MPDVGPSTAEGAISQYGSMLCRMIADSHTGVDVRLRWDQIRMRLDNLANVAGIRTAQDARWKIAEMLEKERDRVMLLDVRMEIDVVLNELRSDLYDNDARKKRPLEELLS